MNQIFTKTEKELIKAGLTMVSERSLGLGEDIQAIYGKLNQAPALVRIDMITVKKMRGDMQGIGLCVRYVLRAGNRAVFWAW
jgi:hypothetical protein